MKRLNMAAQGEMKLPSLAVDSDTFSESRMSVACTSIDVLILTKTVLKLESESEQIRLFDPSQQMATFCSIYHEKLCALQRHNILTISKNFICVPSSLSSRGRSIIPTKGGILSYFNIGLDNLLSPFNHPLSHL